MQRILVDACGWGALVDAGIHFDHGLATVTGPSIPVVTDGVANELSRISEERGGLLLDLLLDRCERVSDPDDAGHVDDGLLTLATENRWPVLTVDRDLKERIAEAGVSYIEVTASRTLRLVG